MSPKYGLVRMESIDSIVINIMIFDDWLKGFERSCRGDIYIGERGHSGKEEKSCLI